VPRFGLVFDLRAARRRGGDDRYMVVFWTPKSLLQSSAPTIRCGGLNHLDIDRENRGLTRARRHQRFDATSNGGMWKELDFGVQKSGRGTAMVQT
jgi:hypothetical protein